MENVFIDQNLQKIYGCGVLNCPLTGYVTGQKWRTETEKQIFVDKFSDSSTVDHTLCTIFLGGGGILVFLRMSIWPFSQGILIDSH